MMPLTTVPMTPSSSARSPGAVPVEKATSDLLMLPDWSLNMEICDSINFKKWDAKDVVKCVKTRLQNKNPKVQLLALTLLETMVKNCSDNVPSEIARRNIPHEMAKIVKKEIDIQVRDKILVLLDSWQEAFGGPAGGKYPQFYLAYDELKRAGIMFPPRSADAAPIHVVSSTLSLSSINSMGSVLDLLADMLQAVNTNDPASVTKDEVVVDLVNQCRSNQKKLMQMLTTTGDAELLVEGLLLNDRLQSVLANHDTIASGSPLLLMS